MCLYIVHICICVYISTHTASLYFKLLASRLCGLASPQSVEQAGRPETEAEVNVSWGQISSPRPPFLVLKLSTQENCPSQSLKSLALQPITAPGHVTGSAVLGFLALGGGSGWCYYLCVGASVPGVPRAWNPGQDWDGRGSGQEMTNHFVPFPSLSPSHPCTTHGVSSQVHTGDQKQGAWALWVLVTGPCSLVRVVLNCPPVSSTVTLEPCWNREGTRPWKRSRGKCLLEEAPTLHVTENAQSFSIEKRNRGTEKHKSLCQGGTKLEAVELESDSKVRPCVCESSALSNGTSSLSTY